MEGQALPHGAPTIEVVVRGNLDAASARSVRDTLQDAIARAPQTLIIDLSECPTIDAAGILLLLEVHRRAIHNGGSMALRSPGERLRRNLRLARVDRVLQVIGPAPGAEETAAQ